MLLPSLIFKVSVVICQRSFELLLLVCLSPKKLKTAKNSCAWILTQLPASEHPSPAEKLKRNKQASQNLSPAQSQAASPVHRPKHRQPPAKRMKHLRRRTMTQVICHCKSFSRVREFVQMYFDHPPRLTTASLACEVRCETQVPKLHDSYLTFQKHQISLKIAGASIMYRVRYSESSNQTTVGF